MPYCTRCGKELSVEAQFCPNCGAPVQAATVVSSVTSTVAPTPKAPEYDKRIVLASWGNRFIAWLIDILIIGSISGLLQLPGIPVLPFVAFGARELILLIYWTLMEGIYGQSIGKMVMRLKVTKLDGSPLTLSDAAIESFGKAFLLPLDCIIGWIAESCKEKRQRLFTMLAKTIVIKISS